MASTEEALTLSVVVPLFNEAENLPKLVEAFGRLRDSIQPFDMELIFVEDGSADNTFELAAQVARQTPWITTLKFARNYGSHAAVAAGLSECRGHCAVFMAADFQDPPELIPKMLEAWKEGFKLVWAAHSNEGSGGSGAFSDLYHKMFNYVVAVPVVKGGVDFALIDRDIIDIIKSKAQLTEPLFAQVTDTGYASTVIRYQKPKRQAGKSGWTMRKKIVMAFLTLSYSLKALRWLFCAAMVLTAASGAAAITTAIMMFHHWELLPAILSIVFLTGAMILAILAIFLYCEFAGRSFAAAHKGHPRFCIEQTVRCLTN
ncbi:MAG: glycosyltransferase family 2 protein [Candidatus Obscuribacterales bacterium]|nr:glycosyltransferase family 2 protein [Candidatus Obscuribacterales bacterium]